MSDQNFINIGDTCLDLSELTDSNTLFQNPLNMQQPRASTIQRDNQNVPASVASETAPVTDNNVQHFPGFLPSKGNVQTAAPVLLTTRQGQQLESEEENSSVVPVTSSG